MKVVQQAIKFPVTTTVGVLLLVLFGTLALFRIPVQLTPTVERPQISVTTLWPGASPEEIEREIVDEQEDQLKSLEGLVEMESTSSDSQGSINLTFQVGSDNDANLLKVSNRLEQVPQYPPDAEKPIISVTGANRQAIAWMVVIPDPESDEPFDGDVSTLFNFIDNQVKPELERVPGVAQSNIFGGREREMHVIFDPSELAARGITLNQLATALDRENRNYSGGDFPEGKRRYIVRTMGEYDSPEEIEDVVVTVQGGTPVYVGDVARAELGYRKPGAKTFFKGQPMIAVNAVKEPGANVLEVMEGLQAARDRIDREVLDPRGLKIHQVYDETDYIDSAIDLVQQSLMLGGVLAIVVLLLFLRSTTSTLVVAVAIPISVVGTFLMMAFFERTLNVISLAGLAFAVGMVVDNSIVVLENIYRHRQMGKRRAKAAYDGTVEVWGAVLASTLTTIAVFVPVVFVEEEAGQLFRDIAIAISCAVGLSLVVAMTVIPSLSSKILGRVDVDDGGEGDPKKPKKRWKNLWGFLSVAGGFRDRVANLVYDICGSTTKRLAVVLIFTTVAVGLSWLLMPKAEYLPTGNRNFLFGILQPPPGYNIDEVARVEDLLVEELGHLWEKPPEETRDLPGGGIRNHFFVALNTQAFYGARARDPLRAAELIPEFNRVTRKVPGAIAFINQASLFSQDIGEGRNIDVDLKGPELERLVELGGEIFGRVMQVVPGSQVRPIPSLDLGNPEVRVVPHRRRLAELGISNRELGFAVSALVDGAKASDYRFEGEEIDLDVQAEESFAHSTHLLEQMPIATARGELVTLGSVGEVVVEDGPTSIQHRERQRSITIQVTPPEEIPLQQAMEDIESQILAPLRERGDLGGLYRAEMSGTADKLTDTANALKWNVVLALIITYLLMSALFESFLYPFVIMFSVPLAALGGFLGLAVLNLFVYQALDILTMLGFVILIGTVVNNAILVVHQSLNHMRDDDMAAREAIREATGNRIRPIFMSVATSVFGMLPLVLFPGAGSELYRGLGSVVVGGLIVSTVFTLILIPALFSLLLDWKRALTERFRGVLDELGSEEGEAVEAE